MTEMGLAEFEVFSFTRSRFTEGGLKFKNSTLDLTTPLLRYFVTSKMGLASISTPNLKSIASPVLDLRKGV